MAGIDRAAGAGAAAVDRCVPRVSTNSCGGRESNVTFESIYVPPRRCHVTLLKALEWLSPKRSITRPAFFLLLSSFSSLQSIQLFICLVFWIAAIVIIDKGEGGRRADDATELDEFNWQITRIPKLIEWI